MTAENPKIGGILPALLTPFGRDGGINTDALERLIDWNIAKGVNGFYVGGSTAEAFLLTEEERSLVYEVAAKATAGRVPLIAHVGSISTEQAIRFARTAERLGYSAVSAIAPFYYKFSFNQIKRYYFDIADATGLPMIIYNFPNFSGVNLTVEQVAEFFADSRFIGIKHTSNDFFSLEQFKSRFPEKTVLNGFDEMLLCGLTMGADGGVGSTYNFMAEKYTELYRLFRAGDLGAAREIQKECNRIIGVLCRVGVMEGEKEVLCQLGLDFGSARPPFSRLSAEQKDLLRHEVTEKL
ncbi:MAG TPA: N-acetylneuraminate lyase [Clostridiales bacterium]|nr:N-acetylneuraminate lyase [Clostridiales bacterium]